MPEQLELPTDRPYPLVADYRGASVAVDWPVELQQRVAAVARAHNVTSFMVVQAALTVLLSKIAATPDVAVGYSIAGRRDPALHDLVGFFVNTLVLRADLSGDPTFVELLGQVRARSLMCRSRCWWIGSIRPGPCLGIRSCRCCWRGRTSTVRVRGVLLAACRWVM
ncbi:hypothetical protein H7J87_01045 [Mycolicibacterium wolinskyi]|nr:hypothetical protein [Mycolicibacterium wolinskyi]